MEINGLAAIVNSAGTLGGIEAPPERADFTTDKEYNVALAAYEARVNPFWKASVKSL